MHALVLAFAAYLLAPQDGDEATSSLTQGLGSMQTAYRAAEEIALCGKVDPGTLKILVNLVRRGAGGDLAYQSSRFIDAFQGATGEDAAEIARYLTRVDLDTNEKIRLVAVLARIGPKAKAEMPLLRQELNKDLHAHLAAAMRVALLSLGDDTRENIDALIADLKAPHCGATFACLLTSRLTPRLPDRVFDELVKLYEEASEDDWRNADLKYQALSMLAAILAQADARAIGVSDQLDRVRRESLADGSPTCIMFSLALARIDKDRREKVIAELVENWAKVTHRADRGTVFSVSEMPFLLMTREMASQCARQLDRDKGREGAVALLSASGTAARGVVPDLLEFISRSADTRKQRVAAEVVGFVCDLAQVPVVRRAADREKSEEVRQALESAVMSVVRLQAR
jgi:hypothetical protein